MGFRAVGVQSFLFEGKKICANPEPTRTRPEQHTASTQRRAARGRLALNPQTEEPSQPVLASVEASTLTISVLVWHSHEFVDRGLYLEI